MWGTKKWSKLMCVAGVALAGCCFIPSLVTAEQMEIDPGVWIEVQPTTAATELSVSVADLEGSKIGIDLTHNTGRQGFVNHSYTIIQQDLINRGATITFVDAGPLTLPILQQYDFFWIEEDFRSTFTLAEKTALWNYVNEGGHLLLHGDQLDGGLIAFFSTPYADTSWAYGGATTDITDHCLTQDVNEVYIPHPVNSLAPVSPAYDIIRDNNGNKMVAVNEIGKGLVVVVSDEIILDGPINQYDNRVLANNLFMRCTINASLPYGLIFINTIHEDQDYARFKMTEMTGLGDAARENDPVDLVFTIESDNGIAYTFSGEGTVYGNSLRLLQGNERITCSLPQEKCLIAIDPGVDIYEENLLNNPLTICLEVNGTVYCNIGDWNGNGNGKTVYKPE